MPLKARVIGVPAVVIAVVPVGGVTDGGGVPTAPATLGIIAAEKGGGDPQREAFLARLNREVEPSSATMQKPYPRVCKLFVLSHVAAAHT